jgi:hypothetical protein
LFYISFELLIDFVGRRVGDFLDLTTEVEVFTQVNFLIVLIFCVLSFLNDIGRLVLWHFFVDFNNANLMEITSTFDDWNALDTSVHYDVVMSA